MTEVSTVPLRMLRVDARAGAVSIHAANVAEPIVESGDAERQGDTLTVTSRTRRVSVTVPIGTDVVVLARAGRVITTGSLGRVVVNTTAGRVDLAQADSVDVRAVAGRVSVDRCVGECRLKLSAGRAELGHVGSLHVMSDAGRVTAREVDDAATIRATSGRVDLGVSGGGDVDIETLHGRIEVTVRGDARPNVDATSALGRVDLGLPTGDDFQLRVTTAHGRVAVGR